MTRADDQSSGRLRPAGAVAHRRLAPWRLRRHAGGRLALAAAVGMVTRVHHDAPDLRPLAEMAGATRLAEALVLVVKVADLADRRHAAEADPAHLARRQTDGRVVALLGEELGGRPGGAHDLAAATRHELDVVDRRAERDVREGQRVADARLGLRTGDDDVADLEAVREQQVALLAVAIDEQADPRGPVRVVLDRREPRRH